MTESEEPRRAWTLISSHGAVLVYLAANPSSTVRIISDSVGLTERQVARILKDLSGADLIEARRVGRRNTYTVNPEARLRHPLLSHVPLERLVTVLAQELARTPDEDG